MGKGAAPSAKADDLSEVVSALKEHARKSPAGDWHVAFIPEVNTRSLLLAFWKGSFIICSTKPLYKNHCSGVVAKMS